MISPSTKKKDHHLGRKKCSRASHMWLQTQQLLGRNTSDTRPGLTYLMAQSICTLIFNFSGPPEIVLGSKHGKIYGCANPDLFCFSDLWCENLGILLPKLFWPTVSKNCSSDRETFLRFKAEGREFSKFLKSLEQFIQTVKGQNTFLTCSWRFLRSNKLEHLEFKLEKNIGI